MKIQNSKKDSDLQLKQYTTANFRCYLIASSTTYEISLLCYARMKAQLVQGWICNNERLCNYINFFGLLRPVSKLLVSISFIYWLPISLEQKIFEVWFLYYFWPAQNFFSPILKFFSNFQKFNFCWPSERWRHHLASLPHFRNATYDFWVLEPIAIRFLPKNCFQQAHWNWF